MIETLIAMLSVMLNATMIATVIEMTETLIATVIVVLIENAGIVAVIPILVLAAQQERASATTAI